MPNLRIFLIITALASPAAAAAAGAPQPVTVGQAVLAPVTTRLELTGTVTAQRRSRLSSRTAGLIETLHVDAGRAVKKGDLLMELARELPQLTPDQTGEELEQSRIEFADAERLVAEARERASRGGVAKSEAESRETGARVKGAMVRQLEIQEKQQRAVIERHRLVAPYDGVISAKLADEGEWVQTGTPVVELVELARPRLDVQVPQENFALIGGGAAVVVKLDSYPGREFAGRIAASVPVKDPVARTFLVRLEWDGGDAPAAPGMSGRAVFTFESDRQVVQVPRDAVVRFSDGSAKVWTITDEGGVTAAKSLAVVLGESLTDTVQVLEGVAAGVRVVVRGNEGLQDGQAVQVLPEPATGKR
ncbi:MAG: efflux RND transporter periplasmic adaptor subunit [Akkermansiaceae bacterium]|nr:efflux RND transporter periplasmic adaptor subunit [Akkermansiaceae bacterium]